MTLARNESIAPALAACEVVDPSIRCESCRACCCRLEVLLLAGDDPPPRMTVEDRWGGAVMRRADDGWCVALDRDSMRCTIYARRPGVCRDYPAGGNDCLVEREKHGIASLPAKVAVATS